MDNDRRSLNLEELIKRLRTVTKAVQLFPFIYSLFFIISLLVYYYGAEGSSRICDSLFYISPMVVALFLILSRLLKLCVWHKTACCIPLIPQAMALVDYYIIELSDVTAMVADIMIFLSIVLFLTAAYNVFFK